MTKVSKKQRRELYATARNHGLSRAEAKNVTSLNQLNRRIGRPIVPTRTKKYDSVILTTRMIHNPYHYRMRVYTGRSLGEARGYYITVVSGEPLSLGEVRERVREKLRGDALKNYGGEGVTIYSILFEEAIRYETP